jgi:hypothetical protein
MTTRGENVATSRDLMTDAGRDLQPEAALAGGVRDVVDHLEAGLALRIVGAEQVRQKNEAKFLFEKLGDRGDGVAADPQGEFPAEPAGRLDHRRGLFFGLAVVEDLPLEILPQGLDQRVCRRVLPLFADCFQRNSPLGRRYSGHRGRGCQREPGGAVTQDRVSFSRGGICPEPWHVLEKVADS